MKPTLRCFLALLLAVWPLTEQLRARGPQEETHFRVSSNLVTVPVSVSDPRNGEPVLNLKASDFHLEEEGQRRQIVSLGAPGKTPLDLALLFDVSGSVARRFEFEQQAASGFLRQIFKPTDSLSVFAIDASPRLVQPRTHSLADATAAVMALQPTTDSTAFYEGVVQAAEYLSKAPAAETRRVILVISDGEDNNSVQHTLSDALGILQRTDCLFYSINPSGPSIRLNNVSLRGQDGMQKLAADTGFAFLPDGDAELQRVFRQIAAELEAQYLLGFYSGGESSEGKFRRIAVSIPDHPEYRVRSRRGYYAPKG
jgi:Ca-activated chloride channel homolog